MGYRVFFFWILASSHHVGTFRIQKKRAKKSRNVSLAPDHGQLQPGRYHVFLDVYPLKKLARGMENKYITRRYLVNGFEKEWAEYDLHKKMHVKYPLLDPEGARNLELEVQSNHWDMSKEDEQKIPHNASELSGAAHYVHIAYHSEVTFVPDINLREYTMPKIGEEFPSWINAPATGLTFGFGSWCMFDADMLQWINENVEHPGPSRLHQEDIDAAKEGKGTRAGSGIKMVLKPLSWARPLISKWKKGARKYYHGTFVHDGNSGIVQKVEEMVRATKPSVVKKRHIEPWSAESYDLLSNNCNSFSDALLRRLELGGITWKEIGLSKLVGGKTSFHEPDHAST